jgi:hypothetical protein
MRWAGWWWAALFCSIACGGSQPSTGVGGGITPPDAGVQDGGSDAGPVADCSSLLPPSPGAAVTFDANTTAGVTCGPSTVDGEGFVACQMRSQKLEWAAFKQNGTRSGTFEGPTQLFTQPAGFIGLQGAFTYYWKNDGNGAPVLDGASALGRTSAGGVIALSTNSGKLTVRKLELQTDVVVDVANATVTTDLAPLGGAEDASGAVLALGGSGGSVSGLWVDLAKGTAGLPFPIGSGTAVAARPLLGGGIAVQLDGRWAATVKPGETTPLAGPSWAGDAADFVPVRGGKAYALIPQTGNVVGIVSVEGNSCGSVKFPGVRSVFVGLDGSAVGSAGPGGCTKLVWRNVLR